jgi:hypothetical protein
LKIVRKPVESGVVCWEVRILDPASSIPYYREATWYRGYSVGGDPKEALESFYQFKHSSRGRLNDMASAITKVTEGKPVKKIKIELSNRNVPEIHGIDELDQVEQDMRDMGMNENEGQGEDEEFEDLDTPYAPPQDNPVIHKTIEILNTLCKHYRYAILRDHQVIEENMMTFYVDYHFQGREIGTISLEMKKHGSGKWVSKNYLSVKRAAKLPITNLSSFIADFKKAILKLHIVSNDSTYVQ